MTPDSPATPSGPDPQAGISSAELFHGIALLGPALFFESAVPIAELPARFKDFTPDTARDYFLLRTAADIQKCGIASQRWIEERGRATDDSPVSKLRLESLLVEQTAWLRRLLEALVTLIGFEKTNANAYFFHYLTLLEFDREHRSREEQRIYFGHTTALSDSLVEAARTKVSNAYATLPDQAACWYLQPGSRPRIRPLRERYEYVLSIASPSERHALGYTCEASFGAASEAIHFSVLEDHEHGYKIDKVVDSFCWLLAIGILCRLHDLAGVEPNGVNARLVRSRRQLDARPPRMSNAAGLGDFVVIEGPQFGEVVEVSTSKFGYEVYRIEALPAKTGAGAIWLPAPSVQLFMSQAELNAQITASIPAEIRDQLPHGPADILKASREAVILMWNIAGPKLFTLGAADKDRGDSKP